MDAVLSQRYRVSLILLTLLVSAVAPLLTATPLGWQLVLLSAIVVVIGLPHGAYDWFHARDQLRTQFGRSWAVPYTLVYVGAGALVVAAWYLAPSLMILAFLVVACVHFGAEDLGVASHQSLRAWLASYARGAACIATICAASPVAVAAIFRAMLGDAATPSPAWFALGGSVALLAAAPWLVQQALLASRLQGARSVAAVVALPALLVSQAVLPPLLAFALFFGFWHALPHTFDLAADRHGPLRPRAVARVLLLVAPLVVVVTFAGIAVARLLAPALSAEIATLRVAFVGLSALAVPHMLQPHVLRGMSNWRLRPASATRTGMLAPRPA